MRNFIKFTLITTLFLGNFCLIYAQQTRVELGDKYFEQRAYNMAIDFYENANKSWKIYAKLGDCYYYTSQPEKALDSYKRAFDEKGKSKVMDQYRLRYAQCLQSSGNEDEAKEEFKKFYQEYFKDNNIEKEINALEVHTFDIDSMDLAENLSVNSENSDFGSFIFNNILYFSSSREKEENRKHNKELYKWNKHPFLEIYTAAIQRNESADLFKLIPSDSSNIDFKTAAHEASIAIINDSTMYFSGGVVDSNNKIVYNKRGVSNLKLQKAKLRDGKWILDIEGTKILDKKLNLENYSVGNPAYDAINKRLFFVSCAPYPDAKGQSDIYYIDMKDGIPIGKVKNVPGINTGGRESFPFISTDGTLYFSSDGIYENKDGTWKLGVGLLDIYKVENLNEIIEKANNANGKDIKVFVDHLGSPFNSRKDDFAFFMEAPNDNNDLEEPYAYFSSNREHPEAQCDDDIYRAKLRITKNEKLRDVQVIVIDSITSLPLKDAFITLLDADENILHHVQVDSTGVYNFKIDPKIVYSLKASRSKYFTNILGEITFNKDNNSTNRELSLKLRPIPCEIMVEPIEFKLNDSIIQPNEGEKLKPLIDLLLEKRDLRIIIESHTDSVGSLAANMKLSQSRANQTRAYLISKNVKESQIINAIGQGENCPLYTTSYINSLATRKEREEAHNKNRRSVFILEDCEDYASDCKKNER